MADTTSVAMSLYSSPSHLREAIALWLTPGAQWCCRCGSQGLQVPTPVRKRSAAELSSAMTATCTLAKLVYSRWGMALQVCCRVEQCHDRHLHVGRAGLLEARNSAAGAGRRACKCAGL